MATRYTVSLPSELYNELKDQSKRQNASTRDVVIRCLKVGLIAMKMDENPNMEIIVREHIPEDDSGNLISKETRLVVM